MTSSPIFVAPEERLSRAKRLMDEYLIRHLPVVRGGKLVGIVSERDVYMVQYMEALAHLPRTMTVDDAMTAEPFAVRPETPLDVVAREMAGRKIGAAVVTEDGAILGVFTATDALRVLADALGGKELAHE
jgi:acetoin utilization protein AcuB